LGQLEKNAEGVKITTKWLYFSKSHLESSL
jgi:hypothetical protein